MRRIHRVLRASNSSFFRINLACYSPSCFFYSSSTETDHLFFCHNYPINGNPFVPAYLLVSTNIKHQYWRTLFSDIYSFVADHSMRAIQTGSKERIFLNLSLELRRNHACGEVEVLRDVKSPFVTCTRHGKRLSGIKTSKSRDLFLDNTKTPK